MLPRIFSLIAGLALLSLALAEFLSQRAGSNFVLYTDQLAISHTILGTVGLLGALFDGRLARWAAQLVGLLAFGFASLGFIPAFDGALAAVIVGVPVPMFETVSHLLLGVVGLFVGFGRDRE